MNIRIAETLAAYTRRERHEIKAAATAFICAAETADPKSLTEALENLDFKPAAWKQILRRDCVVHPKFRTLFLTCWEHKGDAIRDMVNNDLVLLDVLRRFLPPYAGPAVELFRGDTMFNRRRQTYGMSWSADRSAAESFANDVRRACVGGSVLLQTTAPADAIICAPHVLGAIRPAEAEYVVDRRRLRRVTVLQHYSEIAV